MNKHPDNTPGDRTQEFDCLTADCAYHVRYDPGGAIPAFKAAKAPYTTLTVYLTCDNPVTKHTNRYSIKP